MCTWYFLEHSGIPLKKSSDPSSNSRSRYAALRDRRSRVARSKSSAVLGLGHNYDDDDDDEDDEEVWYFKLETDVKNIQLNFYIQRTNSFSKCLIKWYIMYIT